MLGGWSRRAGWKDVPRIDAPSYESCASEEQGGRGFQAAKGICICLREDFLSRLSLAGREVYQSAYSFKKTK